MLAFYRKYRPQKISEIDSEEIRKNISTVLSSSRVPHAFLLVGPRGLGKTSTARIIAKSVNCLKKGKDGEPCGECEMCDSIKNGSNLDVFEMDAASNRGIDEIRDLRDKVKLAPSHAHYKVYIIDEVHMLTNEAFNALLKTLEEPPTHAIFILCTTEPHKLPETIISRCMRFDFKFPSLVELVNSLKRTKKGEKIEVEDGVLELISKASKGSFRDAQKIFDQLSLEGSIITKKTVLLFQTSGAPDSIKLINFLVERDTEKALDWILEKVSKGLDIKLLVEEILEILHPALLKKFIAVPEKEISYSVLDKLEVFEIKKLIDLFSRSYLELKNAVIQELPLEMAVIEWGGDSKVQSFDDDSGKKNESDKKGEEVVVDEIKVDEKSGVELTEEEMVSLWPKVLATVKPYNHSVEALLRSSRPSSCKDGCFIIEVFYKFHKERLEEPKVFELLSKVVGEVFGSKLKVGYILGQRQKPEKKSENIETKDEDMVSAAEEIFGK